jgi:hypothetical protein
VNAVALAGPTPTIGSVNAVALAATIGGSVVGLAGVISNVVLAKLRQGQELDLADKQHVHERELARGDRLYDRRAPVYESMMKIVQPVMEHVESRNPLVQFGNPPPLPPEPTIDEQRDMQIHLRTYASEEIGDAYRGWFRKVRSFQFEADTFEQLRAQGGPAMGTRQPMDTARAEAVEAADNLARLVRDELASF